MLVDIHTCMRTKLIVTLFTVQEVNNDLYYFITVG